MKEVLACYKGNFPGLCSSLFDFFDRREKAQIQSTSQPFALSRLVPLQQMQYEVNQHSPFL